jgi:DNA-binding NtrC family response regulator
MIKPARILIVDDDEVTRRLLQEVLLKEGHVVECAPSGEHAVRELKRHAFTVVLSDIRMMELDGLALLRQVKKLRPDTSVILMTGFGSMEGAVEAIQQGAFDYVSKPFKMDDLKAMVARAARHAEVLARSSHPAAASAGDTGRALIGSSPRILEVYKILARAALVTSPVLLIGEPGSGKARVVKAIHDHGTRRKARYIRISCASMPESALEAEIFGSVLQPGALEEASGGTLFLDEITDLPVPLQIRLLRFLQEGEFKPVGALSAKRADVRIIGSTTSSREELEVRVHSGKFREDLLYRLKAILIEMPPLRERMEDLGALVDAFLIRYSGKNGKVVSHVADEAMRVLEAYRWPGNVRELEHAIESAVAMSRTEILYPEDFPDEIRRPHLPVAPLPVGVAGPGTSLEEIEKQHIIKVLQEVQFNKSRASEILGIDRATLYRKAQRYGIDLKAR